MLFKPKMNEKNKPAAEKPATFCRSILDASYLLEHEKSLLIIIKSLNVRSFFIETAYNDASSIRQIRFHGDVRPLLFSFADDRSGQWLESTYKSESELNEIKKEFEKLYSSKTDYHFKLCDAEQIDQFARLFVKQNDLVSDIDVEINKKYCLVFNEYPKFTVIQQADVKITCTML